MAETTLATLITALTRTSIYGTLIATAQAIGLNTESWQPGDPTRSLFDAVSRIDETRDRIILDAIRGGFLDLAEGGWLTLLARYGFNVERRAATFAECTLRLTNNGAAVVGAIDANDLTVENTGTDATYRNSTGGTLGGSGSTLLVTIIAEVAGSNGTSGVGEITGLVTSLANVTVTNTSAAVGTDGETDPELRTRCRAKLESLSPNGPKGAYHYVVTTPEINAGTLITRTRVWAESATGIASVFVAGAAGAVSGAQVTAAQAVVEDNAEPHCVAATVINVSNVTQAITYTLWVYDSISLTSAEIEDAVETALLAAIAGKAIGGDVIPPATSGFLYTNWIEAQILAAVHPYGFKLTLTTPAADVALVLTSSTAQVVAAGAITATIVQVTP